MSPAELNRLQSIQSSHILVRPRDVYSLASAHSDASKQFIDLKSPAHSGGLASHGVEQKSTDLQVMHIYICEDCEHLVMVR